MKPWVKAVFVFSAVCLIHCTLLGRAGGQEQAEMDLDLVFSNLDLSKMNTESINSVLPLFAFEDSIANLRSGDSVFFRELGITDTDTIKKCIMIGAAWAKAYWDWHYFSRGMKDFEDLKFSTDQNLTTVSHFLESLGADPVLLQRVKYLRSFFETNVDTVPPISEITALREDVRKKIELFLAEDLDRKVSYYFGKWLVYLSEFSFLTLNLEDETQIRFVGQKMTEFHRRIGSNDFWKLIDELPLPHGDLLERIRNGVKQINELIDLDNIKRLLDNVRDLKERIDNLYDLLKVRFF
jgi:hypothetical protein